VVTRLQLGVSRLENLDARVLPTFLDKTWIHFGNPKPEPESSPLKKLKKLLRRHSLLYLINRTFQKLFSNKKKASISQSDEAEMYSQTNFRDFVYQKGDRLPFDNDSIDFIFSEHFFEHLFLDESLSLLRECYRILKPSGVIRTCVPDADLRTYEPLEPVGYPNINLPYTSPDKHKTRWSVYSLVEAIELAGFKAIPLYYCNKSGEYIKDQPSDIADNYEDCPEQELIFDLTYIQRRDSLIVDGIKVTLK
jgi:predicted SAM-dependent methyltransferase